MPTRKPVSAIVFDVNETLRDIAAVMHLGLLARDLDGKGVADPDLAVRTRVGTVLYHVFEDRHPVVILEEWGMQSAALPEITIKLPASKRRGAVRS